MRQELEKNNVIIREEIDSDKNFIYATWLNGLRYGNPVYEFIQKDSYFKNYHKVIDAIMDKDTVLIRVASFSDDPDTILGYSVIEFSTLHWIFVKPNWRKFGIATNLMPNPFVTATHITMIGKSIMVSKYPDAIFDPFKL